MLTAMLAALLQITLKPLMNRMIPFGCAIVCFKSMPRIKYHLDFGNALGGSYSAGAIKGVIQSIIDMVLLSMFVWPQRFVVSGWHRHRRARVSAAVSTCSLWCLVRGQPCQWASGPVSSAESC